MENFFNQHAQFCGDTTIDNVDRLNHRYEGIIADNLPAIRGARILDLGALDGRWAFAALKNGAEHVTCIEMQQKWAYKASNLLSGMNVEVIHADIFQTLQFLDCFDVVFCLGLLYHIPHHCMLMAEIQRMKPKHIIIDTMTAPGNGLHIELHKPAPQAKWRKTNTVTGIPTLSALELMVSSIGYQFRYFGYSSIGWNGIDDYKKHRRVTMTASKNKRAFATLLTNDKLVNMACNLIRSINNNCPSKYDVICLYHELSSESKKKLEESGFILHKIDDIGKMPPPAHTAPAYQHMFNKAYAWGLEYDSIVYLDADILVVADIEELFSMMDLSDKQVLAVEGTPFFSAGVIVLKPNKETEKDIINKITSGDWDVIGDVNLGDQVFWNYYWKDQFQLIDRIYNCTRGNHCTPGCKVIHFNGPKSIAIPI